MTLMMDVIAPGAVVMVVVAVVMAVVMAMVMVVVAVVNGCGSCGCFTISTVVLRWLW